MTIHVVNIGDSIDSIAAVYGVDPFRLAADNEVPASGALAVGQTLVVRFPKVIHAVRAGDTLSSIAAAYGVTVRSLYQNNWALGGVPDLDVGMDIVISVSYTHLDVYKRQAGATGWAVGSHACMGIMPAFAPKPTIITKNTHSSNGLCSSASWRFSAPPPEKLWFSRKWDRKKYPASAIPAPNTEYPRYFRPARRAAGVPL